MRARRDPAAVADPDNWAGGFYELSLEADEPALAAVWRATGARGATEEFGHLRGTVQPPFGGPAVCGGFVTGLDDGSTLTTFYLPLGALARLDRRVGGFPFGPSGGPGSLAWRTELDTWLAGVAEEVFVEAGFSLGVIGFELDPVLSAELGGVVPEERWEGYLLPADGRLTYWPANR
ncbi:hypothetical protein [Amycolatopsis sp. NPDC004378]